MAGLMLIYIVIILALVAVAIYEHVDASSLSLPIPPTLTILTFILPLLAAANALFLPRLLSQSVSSSQWHLLHPAVLQTLQAILTTVLATLFLSSAVPSDTLNCGLTTTWQRLFSAHDASSIQRIQDAFDCCGLNSVRDRAWPWRAAGVVQCPERYGRSDACAVPWRSAMQRNAGVEFGVTIAVGLLQIISFFLARRFRPDRREGGWADLLNRPRMLPASGRPLLPGQETESDDVEEGHNRGKQKYGSTDGQRGLGPGPSTGGLPEVQNEWGDDN